LKKYKGHHLNALNATGITFSFECSNSYIQTVQDGPEFQEPDLPEKRDDDKK
jgi:hypothetical protein